MTRSPSQLVSKHREILYSSVRVRTEETLQSSPRSDAPHMQGWCVRIKIKDSSKNGEYKPSSESFIPPHVYDTWHGEERENIKCMEKSTWLRQDIFTKTMLP